MSCDLNIGAVTVTYNSSGVIEDFLASWSSQSYPNVTLWIVDNASSDTTMEHLHGYSHSTIRIIQNRTNIGYAEANNQGICAALDSGCDAVLMINNDTEFGPSLIHELVHGLNEHACDMIAPKIVFHGDRKVIWSAGGGFDRLRGHAGFHYGLGQADTGQFDTPRKVQHAPACCLLVRRQVFTQIGLMDPRYFVYLEDTDFCYRAKQAGATLIYLPSAVLLHKASTLTGGSDSDFSVRYRTRNQIYFMLKNLGVLQSLFYLPAFQIYQLIKLLSRNIDVRGFVLREKAFVEGLQVWMQSVAQ